MRPGRRHWTCGIAAAACLAARDGLGAVPLALSPSPPPSCSSFFTLGVVLGLAGMFAVALSALWMIVDGLCEKRWRLVGWEIAVAFLYAAGVWVFRDGWLCLWGLAGVWILLFVVLWLVVSGLVNKRWRQVVEGVAVALLFVAGLWWGGAHVNPCSREFEQNLPHCCPEPAEADMFGIWDTISVEQLRELVGQDSPPPEELIGKRFRLVGIARCFPLHDPDLPLLLRGCYYYVQDEGEDTAVFPVRGRMKFPCRRPFLGDKLFLAATLQKDPDDGWYLQEEHSWIFDFWGYDNYLYWKYSGGYEFAIENAFRRGFVGMPELTVGEWKSGKRTTQTEIDRFLHHSPWDFYVY